MAEPLDVGVLGVGNIGMVHLQSARTMDDVTVRAAADPVPFHRERAANWGVDRTYDDYETLLAEEELDAAIVAVPPFLHRDAVERAAEEGIDVFVEKPLARSVEEADQLLSAADEAGISVGVDHTIRYQADVRAVQEEYASGQVGHVPFASITRINNGPFDRPPAEGPIPEWPLDADAAGGGALLELGVHLFDVLEWLFGDVEVLAAETSRQLDVPVEDAATVVCRSRETGTVVVLHCGTYQWEELPDVNMGLRLEGISGTLDSREHTPENFHAHAARSVLSNLRSRVSRTDPKPFEPTYYLQAHYEALSAFFTAIENGDRPPVDGEIGRRAVKLVEDAYDAAETERRIEEEIR